MLNWLSKLFCCMPTEQPAFALPKFPSASISLEWMCERVVYYQLHYGDVKAANLFDPSTSDYMPLSIHVGSVWNDERQREYRLVKSLYPQLVQLARDSFKNNGMYFQSRVGDLEDFDPEVKLLP